MVAGAGFKFASNGSILGKSIKGKVVDVDTALDGYSQGATIVINDLAKLWPSLTAHKDRMEDQLRIPVSANLYLTPEEERGFNPHYDMDDTFILQLEGVKEWVNSQKYKQPRRCIQHLGLFSDGLFSGGLGRWRLA